MCCMNLFETYALSKVINCGNDDDGNNKMYLRLIQINHKIREIPSIVAFDYPFETKKMGNYYTDFVVQLNQQSIFSYYFS